MQPSASAPDLSNDGSPPSTRPLLSPSESLFHACLENLTYQRCHIQCKPRLADVLQHETLAGFHKICQRHIDFLIYRKEDWQPMLAIEFDDNDKSASRLSRKARDRLLVHDILLSVSLPFLSVHAKEINDMETLMHKLTAAWHQRCAALETAPPPDIGPEEPRPATEPLEISPPTVRVSTPAPLAEAA